MIAQTTCARSCPVTDTSAPLRRIRSFVRREGRLTAGQQRALDVLFPRFGIETSASLLDFTALFGRDAPTILEIGFGNGDTLAQIARNHPENNYLGIEVHRPGVGHLLMRIEEYGLSNVRVMCADAVEILQQQIADGSLEAIYLFFPDPWHKKRHHKRRQVQPAWAQLIRRKLKIGGYLHMATDWQEYADHMLTTLGNAEGFHNQSIQSGFIERPAYRPITKFELRGARLGHGVWDLMFMRIF